LDTATAQQLHPRILVFGILTSELQRTAANVVYGQYRLAQLRQYLKCGAAAVAAQWLVVVNKVAAPVMADMQLKLVMYRLEKE
jgi:hypothetical protein